MNNRVIKFRAWDNSLNCWINDFKDFVPLWRGGNENDKFTLSGAAEGAGAEIEQFTGFYDKNGKEIYEGDIVKLSLVDERKDSDIEEGKTVGVIRWLDKAACYSLSHPEMPASRYDLYLADERTPRGDGEFNHTYTIAPWRFEVIGNIREHAERIPSIQSLIKNYD